jgi:hypothetical protein
MAQWTNGEANGLWQETNGFDNEASSSSYSGRQNGMRQGNNGFDNEASSSSSYSGRQNGMWRGTNGKDQNRFEPYSDPSVSQRTNGIYLRTRIKTKQYRLNYHLDLLRSLKLDHPDYFVTALNTLRAAQDLEKLLGEITNGFDNEASSSSGRQNGLWQETNGTDFATRIKTEQYKLNSHLNSLLSLLSLNLNHPNYSATAKNTLRAVQDLDKLLDEIIMLFTPPEKTFETNSMDNGQANGIRARFERAIRTGDIATINKLAPHM